MSGNHQHNGKKNKKKWNLNNKKSKINPLTKMQPLDRRFAPEKSNLQPAFVWHILAFTLHLIFLMYFLAYPELQINTVIHKLMFFTNFNQLCLVAFYLKVLIDDLQAIKQNRDKLHYSKQTLELYQLMLFTGLFVTLVFWIGYTISKGLFLSQKVQNIIPFWFLVVFHGSGFITLLIDTNIISLPQEKEVNYLKKASMWDYMGGIYFIITMANYCWIGKFVYPFQKNLPLLVNLLSLIIFHFAMKWLYGNFPALIEKIKLSLKKQD